MAKLLDRGVQLTEDIILRVTPSGTFEIVNRGRTDFFMGTEVGQERFLIRSADTSGSGSVFQVRNGNGTSLAVTNAGAVQLGGGNVVNAAVINKRQRFTVAQVNAGAELLAAAPGLKYRMIECLAIAIGGAVAVVTTVDVLATQATLGVKLVAYAQANLTQSTVLKAGGTGATVLADGASYAQNDVNTAITVGKTGGDITTATHIDFIFTYALEA